MIKENEFELYLHKIINDHSGYCSGNECEEQSQGIETSVVFVKRKNLSVEALEQLENLKPENFFVEGPLFNYLKFKYEESEDVGGGSGYCSKGNSKFEKHTSNVILKAVRFLDE